MKLYGSIKNKKGGFPTLNPTPMFLLQFNPLISKIWDPNISSEWFTRLEFSAIIKSAKRRVNSSEKQK